jgi:hypothetical protein
MNTQDMTPTEYAQILRSYIADGKRLQDFSKDYQLDGRFVSAIILRFKIQHTFTGRESKVTEADVRRWTTLYKKGKTITHISMACNYSVSLISAYLKAYEVQQGETIGVNQPIVVDPAIYKYAALEAANYWKDRCDKFHRFWADEVETPHLSQ